LRHLTLALPRHISATLLCAPFPAGNMGRTHRVYLAGEVVYKCKKCDNHLAVKEGLISPNFQGQHGKAILVHHVVNVTLGDPEERGMRTGKHVVRDMYCQMCEQYLGWKYDLAYSTDQKYKEGHFILECALILEVEEEAAIYEPPLIIQLTIGDSRE